jgi:UDP-N-acetylglucosamine 2-epimerase
MLLRLARVLEHERPDWLLVYGDTTSTLAGALAGAQCGVPVAHVEAGLRSFVRTQPEERNRVISDHLADCLFCPTTTAVRNLRREGIGQGVYLVGDPMQDALAEQWPRARRRPLRAGSPDYLFCTVHRAENTDHPKRLRALVRLLAALEQTIVLPLHPRTRQALKAQDLWWQLTHLRHVELHGPFGYLDSLRHIRSARAVLTDSGGVQREAFWLGTPCLTLRPVTEWVETVVRGANVLVDLDMDRVRAALTRRRRKRSLPARSQVSRKIAKHLLSR